jgi:hypothetical protein
MAWRAISAWPWQLAGGTVTVGVKLKSKPLAEIILSISTPLVVGESSIQISIHNFTDNSSAVTPTFDTDTWDVYQYFNVSAIDDTVVGGLLRTCT